MILGVTGHRPQKITNYNSDRLLALAVQCLKRYEPDKIITGMALGWDTAIAQAALMLSIPYIAAVPFQSQDSKWCDSDKAIYEDLLWKSDKIVQVDTQPGYTCNKADIGHYHLSKMFTRNRWIVDNSDEILALYNGSEEKFSGTRHCLNYAHNVNKKVINVWSSWVKYN